MRERDCSFIPSSDHIIVVSIFIYITHITVDAQNYVYVICMYDITLLQGGQKMAGVFVLFLFTLAL